MKRVTMTKKECKTLLKDHYKEIDDQYKKTGVLSKGAQYRIDHSIAVSNIVKNIIKNNPNKFPDKELNKEFIKACLLHDTYKLEQEEHHAEYAGLGLMTLGFSNDSIVPITLHSVIKKNTVVDIDMRKEISNYLLVLQDADIVSKYNLKSIINSHDGIEDTLDVIYRLIKRLERINIYFNDAEIILKDGIADMLKYVEYHNAMDRFKDLNNIIINYGFKYYNR